MTGLDYFFETAQKISYIGGAIIGVVAVIIIAAVVYCVKNGLGA